jgi:hypothetical protein
VALTREQVESAPSIDNDAPVSRQHELALAQHFQWPIYWGGGILSAPTTLTYPTILPREPVTPPEAEDAVARAEQTGDPHLHSMRSVEGYAIHACDGGIGHVSDFVVDHRAWAVRYLEADTRNWLPGKHVLISPAWLGEVSWDGRCVDVSLTKDQINAAPEYRHGEAITREYEDALYTYYGQPIYWRPMEPAARR